MSEVLIEKEIIGYGAGTSFVSTLASIPLKPRSVKVFVDYSTSVEQVTDNGLGQFIGTGITGSVDYSTGDIAINSSMIVPTDNQVFVSYTYFSQGVTELNKIQYVQQDFQTIVEGIIQFIKNNFPEELTDYQASNMAMALIDINAWVSQNLAWYLNRKVTDLYFPTAKTPNSISKLSRLLGYKARGASASIASLRVTLEDGPYAFAISVPVSFGFEGPRGLTFEYRGSTPIVFLPGEVVKSFDVYEGKTVTETYISNGATNQVFDLLQVGEDEFVEGGSIKIVIDGMEWEEKPIIPFELSEYFESDVISFPPTIKFGDGVQGLIPPQGSAISISYVICNGLNGRIAANSITDTVNPLVANFEVVPLIIEQPSASAGGDNPEDLRAITANAPLFQKVQDRAITKEDYDFLVGTFPNVAKGDASVIRSVKNDLTIQKFVEQCDLLLSQLRQADRYLLPRPQIVNLKFGADLFETCEVGVDIDGVTLTQAFDGDNATTLELLAEQIADEPNVASAVVASCDFGNVINVTAIAETEIVADNLAVTADSAPVVTKTEISVAPNQVWRLAFDKDFFFGNILNLTYSGVPITIPWEFSHVDMFERLAQSLAGFAEAPKASIVEISAPPNQVTEITFNKNLFAGCNVFIRMFKTIAGFDDEEITMNVAYIGDHDDTLELICSRLEGFSFINNASAAGGVMSIGTETRTPITQPENLGFTNGTSKVFVFQLANRPVPWHTGAIGITPEKTLLSKTFFVTYDGYVFGFEETKLVVELNVGGTVVGSVAITDVTLGEITFTFDQTIGVPPPTPGKSMGMIGYTYQAYTSVKFSEVLVEINTVTYDTNARTIDIATDGSDTLTLTGESVSARTAPSLVAQEVQDMISEDLGSVSSIADEIDAQKKSLFSYLDNNLNDGCRANIVQVSVLAKDQSRKYVIPPPSLLTDIFNYLEPRKDVTHSVSVVSGFAYVIEVQMTVEVQVSGDAIEDVVVQKIEDAIKKSDAKPYGILVERDFNKSLYVSEVYEAINQYLEPEDYNYLNVIIEAPTIHPTNLYELEVLSAGTGLAGQVVSTQINNIPIVRENVKILVDGVEVAEDDGLGNIVDLGVGFGITGVLNYANGAISMTFTSPVVIGKPIQTTYFKSLIDGRGNLICPKDHVLQYGTVTIVRLAKL